LKDKNVVVVDDVISTGHVAKGSIADIKEEGGNPILIMVMVNKTSKYELDGVPVRSLIRARTIA
jgi:orotate phosphoribosyltransferase